MPVERVFEGVQPGLSNTNLALQVGLLIQGGEGILASVDVPHP